jgi:hypothetical protein
MLQAIAGHFQQGKVDIHIRLTIILEWAVQVAGQQQQIAERDAQEAGYHYILTEAIGTISNNAITAPITKMFSKA